MWPYHHRTQACWGLVLLLKLVFWQLKDGANGQQKHKALVDSNWFFRSPRLTSCSVVCRWKYVTGSGVQMTPSVWEMLLESPVQTSQHLTFIWWCKVSIWWWQRMNWENWLWLMSKNRVWWSCMVKSEINFSIASSPFRFGPSFYFEKANISS